MSHKKNYFKESILIRLIQFFIKAYRVSYSYRIFNKFLCWNKNSFIYRKWINYVSREPISIHSRFYKILKHIFIKIDLVIDKIYKTFIKVFEKSSIYKLINLAKYEVEHKKINITLMSIIGFLSGYIGISFLTGNFKKNEIIITILILILSLGFVKFKTIIIAFYKTSLFYKFYKNILD